MLFVKDCRELSAAKSSDPDVSVVVLGALDADKDCRDDPFDAETPLTLALAEK